LEIADAFEKLVNQTNRAIAAVNEQATLEATTAPSSNFSQLPDLRLQGSFTWEKRTITLNDRSRDAEGGATAHRIFPTDIYLPVARQLRSQNTPRPVIVISHGLGSDRTSFEYNAIGPNPALARLYVKALSVAFFQTYIANQPSYRPYLSAAYANAISREPLKLNLVRSLSTTELEQALKGSTVPPTMPSQ
jgi:predicted dienelactone hydrolase